jgi:hypothetical protein
MDGSWWSDGPVQDNGPPSRPPGTRESEVLVLARYRDDSSYCTPPRSSSTS